MSSLRRIIVAILTGAVIAWTAGALVLDVIFAYGKYRREALVEMPPWAFFVIGAAGGTIGMLAVLLAGQKSLPGWVRPVVIGSLAGVATVVLSTSFVSSWLGGSSSKTQAPYLHAGLVYGVPVGLLTGGITGLVAARRRSTRTGQPPV